MNTATILGISPGTRAAGIAVLRGGVLLYQQVHTFPGKWSPEKLRLIMGKLDSVAKKHGVTDFAVKVPDTLPNSIGFTQLIGSLNILCGSLGAGLHYYPLSDILDRFCRGGEQNKTLLLQAIVEKHPELLPEYKREQKNRDAYYHKVFEAVAVAHLSRKPYGGS